MNLRTAIDRFRLNPLRDSVQPYLWSDAELAGYFSEIRDQLCEQAHLLITDSSTPQVCQIIAGVDSANVAQGTNAATIQVATAFDFLNADTEYTFAVTNNIAMTACAVQAVSTYCRYLLSTDSAFSVTVQKGSDAATDAAAYLPMMTEGLTPIAMLLIQTSGAVTFTSGTNSLDDAGITATFESSSNPFSISEKVQAVDLIQQANYTSRSMSIQSIQYMNKFKPGWRTTDPSIPEVLISGENTDEYRIWPEPEHPEQIRLTVQRLPISALSSAGTGMNADMEIADQYVARLHNGVAQLALLKRDAETFDPQKAAGHGYSWNGEGNPNSDIEQVKRILLRRSRTAATNTIPGAFF